MIDPPLYRRHRNRPSDLYDEQIIKLEKEGSTVKEIDDSLREQGYTGTYSAVRTIVERVHKERKYNLSKEQKIHISRKKLSVFVSIQQWFARGQINRLKTFKRMTYGRAGLELLEKRILYRM